MLESLYFAFWNLVAFALVMWFAVQGRREESRRRRALAEEQRNRRAALRARRITAKQAKIEEERRFVEGLMRAPAPGGALEWD
ncbi:MAG: hypothetical protein D6757_11120 [Alphaproteobacteria bacterium]|nr:MAG: hypothetical protein D6757_11120 [Alphaproteobacteria bacterium]